MTFHPRKVDADALRKSSFGNTIQAIEKERRARYQRTHLEMGEDIPRPKRLLGKTDITDVPSDVPWQKIALDELGKAYPVNKHWVCENCGQVRLGSFPPVKCSRCGTTDQPLARINWRR
jgi:rubrerythrin